MTLLKDLVKEAEIKYGIPKTRRKAQRKNRFVTTRNSSGFCNLWSKPAPTTRQGYTYIFMVMSNYEPVVYLTSVDLLELFRKVRGAGFDVIVSDYDAATRLLESEGLSWDILEEQGII